MAAGLPTDEAAARLRQSRPNDPPRRLFVIRTAGNPLRSRPSAPLVATCLSVVGVGVYLPFSPAADVLGFTPLPIGFFGFVAVATPAYLVVVEMVKRRLLRQVQ